MSTAMEFVQMWRVSYKVVGPWHDRDETRYFESRSDCDVFLNSGVFTLTQVRGQPEVVMTGVIRANGELYDLGPAVRIEPKS